jgi:excisionase family DNA binding protein
MKRRSSLGSPAVSTPVSSSAPPPVPSVATVPPLPPVAAPGNVRKLMTPKELASFLGVSPATIRRRLHLIPHVRIGNRVRFISSDVVNAIRELGKI